MPLKYAACVPIHLVDRTVYSFDCDPPSGALLRGRSLFTIPAGATVAPADVDGPASFAELCDADAIGPEDSGDVRLARQRAAGKEGQSHA